MPDDTADTADHRAEPPDGPTKILPPDTEAILPETIGNYRIIRALGEGGMGVVYLAEQTEPLKRTVALKLIKLGMDTKRVIARFEAERQALAMMDHPGVAKVLEAGATDTGRPYFVMEHVPGLPITDYCDQERLNTDERLALFMQVCDAVQHAHQKGIIHRDIKPGNILVAVREGDAIPKVIDFGVAKATQQKLTEKTLFTEQGQLIGTPEYMSPEQAEMAGLDVDTRTDIYALGVLLYELLTGSLPFESSELRRAAFDELRRVIREEDPHKPSTRLSSLGAESGTIARCRRTDPRALERELRGDLDWITMKAMEKNRTRRYATASALMADLARHLRSEPVMAGPPTAGYRMGKFIKRHRVGVVFTVFIGVAIFAGALGTTWQAAKAREARRGEAVQEQLAQTQTELAQQQTAIAAERQAFADKAEELHNELVAIVSRIMARSQQLDEEGSAAEALWVLKELEALIARPEVADSTMREQHGEARVAIIMRALQQIYTDTPEFDAADLDRIESILLELEQRRADGLPGPDDNQ